MKLDREERRRPVAHLLQHRSEGWPFSLNYPLYLRIDDFHVKAHAQWRDRRWNIVIVRNVGAGPTGAGKVTAIEYDGTKPGTIIDDDLADFELRSILPGESYAKLFAVQDKDPQKEDTPRIRFKYECENLPEQAEYPPPGKKDWFIDVYPETPVRLVDDGHARGKPR